MGGAKGWVKAACFVPVASSSFSALPLWQLGTPVTARGRPADPSSWTAMALGTSRGEGCCWAVTHGRSRLGMLQIGLWKSLTPSLSADSQVAHPPLVLTEAGGGQWPQFGGHAHSLLPPSSASWSWCCWDSGVLLVWQCQPLQPHSQVGLAYLGCLLLFRHRRAPGRVHLEGALCGKSLIIPPLHECLNWLELFSLSPRVLDLRSPSFPQVPRRPQH